MTLVQATFDLDALMPAQPKPGALFYECGTHVQHTDWQGHLADCWHGQCPACGEPMSAWFDFHVNHGPAWSPAWAESQCSKQHLLLNHMRYICQNLDAGVTTTNCFALAHRGSHKANGYFANGAPVDCMLAEYAEKRAWLLEHRIAQADLPMPHTPAARDIIGALVDSLERTAA